MCNCWVCVCYFFIFFFFACHQVGMLVFSQYPEKISDVGGTWEPGYAIVVIAAGYFGYDILNCIVRRYNWAYIVHGTVCFVCYFLVATNHTFERDSIFFLSWEITTVVLNLIKAETRNSRKKRMYKKVFFVLFLLVRIVGGCVYTVRFLRKICFLNCSGFYWTTMVPFCIISCVANGLNTFWFAKLMYMAVLNDLT